MNHIFVDEQGNMYEIEDKSVLKISETIIVYDESGEKFELNKKDAENLKLANERVDGMVYDILDRDERLLNMYHRVHPEAAFARAPEAAFARAPEA